MAGEIPALGEVWQPVGHIATILAVHVVRVEAVRPFVPAGLQIVPVWRGSTLATVLMSDYGEGSTLPSRELAIAGALVHHAGRVAPLITHIYVDSPDSVVGGRRMGLPKELATFDWRGDAAGSVSVARADGVAVLTLRYARAPLALPLRVGAPTISTIGREVWRFGSWMRGRWGLCSTTLAVPAGSPLEPLGLGRPVASIGCGAMRGELGGGMRRIGDLATQHAGHAGEAPPSTAPEQQQRGLG
jgi:hypothetical protein